MSSSSATAPADLLLRAGAWHEITPETAGWTYISFGVESLRSGARLAQPGDDREWAIVPLAGRVEVAAGGQTWTIGARTSVFDGRGDCLYLPRDMPFEVIADTDAEIALCGARCERALEPRLARAAEAEIEVRGAGNATRQIHPLVPPNFPADRLLVVEVWTPGGNWSSYPPHKHDEARDGEVVLEETYYYRTREPQGFALQRLYDPVRRVDESWAVRDGDLLVIPSGYHTTCAAHGHDLYYLNVLAGPGATRSLQACEDPDLVGTRAAWPTTPPDPRVPIVSGTGSLKGI